MQINSTTSGMPILVVDDYPLVAATIKGLLRSEGFEAIDVAYGGPDALEKLAGRKYRLVISDMKMPGMTGLDLLRAIRKIDDRQDTRFLMITGDKTADLGVLKRAGVDAVLVKPFSPETLKGIVDSIFAVQPKAA